MKNKLRGPLALLFLAAFFLLPYLLPTRGQTEAFAERGGLEMHVIDVGQGDAILLLNEGEAVLVDAGTNQSEGALRAYLDELGVERLELLVLTHPHEDHVGGADMILREYDVGEVLVPTVQPEEEIGRMLDESYAESDATVRAVCAGEEFSVGKMVLFVLSPLRISDKEMNDNSIVLRVDFGETAFLLMGDAEAPVEDMLLQTCAPALLDCDVLKAGHHGSDSSSGADFLSAVSPRYVVISCGSDNTYNHPMQGVLDAIAAVGGRACRTDTEGTVVLISDGKTVCRSP